MRVIWQYWETKDKKPAFIDGFHEIARNNAGVSVILVTPDNLKSYLPDLPSKVLDIERLAHKADMIRTLLVQKHGGMWLDSDAIVLQDLNWLFDLLTQYEFVTFASSEEISADQKVQIVCFLSRPNGKVITEWVNAQHAKFPRTTYKWTEIGSDALEPICLKNMDRIKFLPFKKISPIGFKRSKILSSRWRSAHQIIADCPIFMLYNKVLPKYNKKILDLTVTQMAQGNTLISDIVKRAINGNYNPPAWKQYAELVVKKAHGAIKHLLLFARR